MVENNLNRPKVGIGVFVFKDGKVLLGKRKGSHAPGMYAGPGGHLEYMESIEDCAKREVKEEAGIEIENIKLLCVSNLKTYAPKHYLDIGLVADWKSGTPKVLEPEKCEGWNWYSLDNLPKPLFATLANYIEALKTGRNYFDS
ncbi:MAG: NUDIX domain-containing protein [Patescibacteria group bacterium]